MQNTVNINYNVINVIDYIHLYNNRHLLLSCCSYCFTENQSQSHPSNCGSSVDSDLLVIILYGDRDSFSTKDLLSECSHQCSVLQNETTRKLYY